MIVVGQNRRWIPSWWARRCGMRAARIALAHPGFERFVLQVRPAPAVDLGHMIDPACEPAIRKALARGIKLDPPVQDDDPFTML